MATTAGFQPKPEVGDILLVIHDFIARSSDELSLAKGDRVELIERDDEFGDGWFLGRHMVNGNSGLFPEVYTRPSPKGVSPTTTAPKSALAPATAPVLQANTNGTSTPTNPIQSAALSGDGRPGTSSTTISSKAESTPILPLNATKAENSPIVAAAPLVSKTPTGPPSFNSMGSSHNDSAMLHETLTVIDEHMNDLHSTPSTGALHHATDSSSEYSAQLHDRLSYIQGEETDEEEEELHSRPQVEAWTADDVAEYLFTSGVEKKHCEVFRDQEISGEVLLGMDQSSLFLKAFDLGSVGRRLKTWQKIKSLQDEVNGLGPSTNRTTQNYGSEAGSDVRVRSRANTLTNSQMMPPITTRSSSAAGRRLSQSTPKMDPVSPMTPVSPNGMNLNDSPTRPSHLKRPSAASIRDLHHSRRHSSTVDNRFTGTTLVNSTPKMGATGFPPPQVGAGVAHKKQPSFDRNWTMGSANGSFSQRPLSASGFQGLNITAERDGDQSASDVDRGYFSGTEIDNGRKRNTLKKRDTISGHSAKSSYADEQRARSGTALARHSRFGSMDSVSGTAAAKYFGVSNPHRRTASTATTESLRPVPPSKDYPSPTVTKLDALTGGTNSPISPAIKGGSEWQAKAAKMSGFGGLRAISDAVTGNERAKFAPPGSAGSFKDSPMQSPSTRTGSSTPSGGPSLDLDSPNDAKAAALANQEQRKPQKKDKKETSAYMRGLAKIGPKEAIKDADFHGWLRKRNANIMSTWKPRFFVLRGRRLAYYYSEDDTEEKGIIDISFHRVLPANDEKLTGLHATLTGASNIPIAASDSTLPTAGNNDDIQKGDDTMFIFKLQPPRAGLSKAVTFTKPVVHYFAVPNLQQGRAWMAALMKATIDRDDTVPMTSTYQAKTISLAKARQQRQRPPALMTAEERAAAGLKEGGSDEKKNGLGISFGEVDSAVSGLEKMGLQSLESSSARPSTFDAEKSGGSLSFLSSPQSA